MEMGLGRMAQTTPLVGYGQLANNIIWNSMMAWSYSLYPHYGILRNDNCLDPNLLL